MRSPAFTERCFQTGSTSAWGIDATGNWLVLVEEDVFWRCQSHLCDGLVVPKERNNPDFALRGFVT